MPKREENKILVVGLPPGSTSSDLMKLVKPVGNPLSATMAIDADGKERGFGFVQFADAATQKAAIAALDKTAVAGRTLNVRAVEDRSPGGGAAGPRAAGGNKGRPCYDFARGKCARGAACRWAHIAPPTANADADDINSRSRRPEWQKKRAHAATDEGAETILTGIPEDICRKYQLGTCHRGVSCRWKHVLWKSATSAAATGKKVGGSGGGDPSSGGDAKRARIGEASGAAAGASAAAATSRLLPGAVGGGIGGGGALSPYAQAMELRNRLKQKEGEWRAANPGAVPKAAAVPEEVKRRDVLWRALERKLARIAPEAGEEGEGDDDDDDDGVEEEEEEEEEDGEAENEEDGEEEEDEEEEDDDEEEDEDDE